MRAKSEEKEFAKFLLEIGNDNIFLVNQMMTK